MKVARFHEFILEKYSTEELKRLIDLGVITKAEAAGEIRKAGREEFMENDDEITVQELKAILSTEGARKLMAKGLHHVSSRAQLKNGNIVFSLDPNYHSAEGWGIGFFSGVRAVRRMTPKRVQGLVWRRTEGSMDIIIRKFSSVGSDLEFFDKAFAWAADHINFDISPEEQADPKSWKYYVNKRSRRDLDNRSDNE